jgi:hypothetical protein
VTCGRRFSRLAGVGSVRAAKVCGGGGLVGKAGLTAPRQRMTVHCRAFGIFRALLQLRLRRKLINQGKLSVGWQISLNIRQVNIRLNRCLFLVVKIAREKSRKIYGAEFICHD